MFVTLDEDDGPCLSAWRGIPERLGVALRGRVAGALMSDGMCTPLFRKPRPVAASAP